MIVSVFIQHNRTASASTRKLVDRTYWKICIERVMIVSIFIQHTPPPRRKNVINEWINNTAQCRYNAAQFITILPKALLRQQLNVNETSNSQQTPHTSSTGPLSDLRYMYSRTKGACRQGNSLIPPAIACLLWGFWKKKTDRVITTPHWSLVPPGAPFTNMV